MGEKKRKKKEIPTRVDIVLFIMLHSLWRKSFTSKFSAGALA
jgi:hypothetical protein